MRPQLEHNPAKVEAGNERATLGKEAVNEHRRATGAPQVDF
jgi:hypothetical protein